MEDGIGPRRRSLITELQVTARHLARLMAALRLYVVGIVGDRTHYIYHLGNDENETQIWHRLQLKSITSPAIRDNSPASWLS